METPRGKAPSRSRSSGTAAHTASGQWRDRNASRSFPVKGRRSSIQGQALIMSEPRSVGATGRRRPIQGWPLAEYEFDQRVSG